MARLDNKKVRVQPWLPDFRGLPFTFWVLWTGMLVNRLGGFVLPFLALILTHQRGYSVLETGRIVCIYGIGSTLASLSGGYLADRIGRKPTMVLSLLVGPPFGLGLLWGSSALQLSVCAFLVGLLGDLYRPTVSAAVADVVAEDKRTNAFGLIYWVMNIGVSVSLALGGWLAESNVELLFYFEIFSNWIFAFLVLVWVPETRPGNYKPHAHFLRSFFAAFQDLKFMAFVACNSLIAFLMHQTYVTMPLDISEHGVSPSVYGLLMAGNGVGVVLLQPFAIAQVGRFARLRVLAIGAALTGIGFGINAFASEVQGYALGILLWTLGEVSMAPLIPAVVADLSPSELRGRYQGALSVGYGTAAVTAPLAGTYLLTMLKSEGLWLSCLLIGLISAFGFLRLQPIIREFDRKE